MEVFLGDMEGMGDITMPMPMENDAVQSFDSTTTVTTTSTAPTTNPNLHSENTTAPITVYGAASGIVVTLHLSATDSVQNNCTSAIASGCTAVTCAANKFDTNLDATDGCENGCPVVTNAMCDTCSDKDTCTSVTCFANYFQFLYYQQHNLLLRTVLNHECHYLLYRM